MSRSAVIFVMGVASITTVPDAVTSLTAHRAADDVDFTLLSIWPACSRPRIGWRRWPAGDGHRRAVTLLQAAPAGCTGLSLHRHRRRGE
jgi:hypothetical protein